MLCSEPVNLGTRQVPCGTCTACLVNRRRDWTARLLLHQAGHAGASCFVTLTYNDEWLPFTAEGDACFSRDHYKQFIQRLRRACGDLRYCFVGEYGERSGRPHYHALIFSKDLELSRHVREAWTFGFVDIGEVSEASIVYTISYILKGTSNDGFARFSEGLGTNALPELRRIARPDGDGVLQLPREFRLNGQVWPLPKYLRAKLVAEGFSFNRRSDEVLEESFVSALRMVPRKDAVSAITDFRKEVALEVAGRRVRSKARIRNGVAIRKKYETL